MFDTKKFIVEVKRRPAIYDTKCLQYNDRNAKSKAWQEVCKAVQPEWDKMDDEEKVVEGKLTVAFWREDNPKIN